MQRLGLSLLLFLAPGAPLAAWGAKGHKASAGLALRTLPPELRAWFKGREEAFRDRAVEPDRWKDHDRKEGPRHFLDSEAYGGPAGVPFEVEAAMAKVGKAEFQKQGLLPWVIQDRFRDLVDAFRAGDPDKVVAVAGWLGHYVGDAQVPLHTTENHDGQLTNQRGVHGRWETGLVERYIVEDTLEVRAAKVDGEIMKAPWAWMEASHALMPKVLEDDKAADRTTPATERGKRRDTPYWMMYWAAQGPTVKQQLRKSGECLGDAILTAWVAAGKPKVTPIAPASATP